MTVVRRRPKLKLCSWPGCEESGQVELVPREYCEVCSDQVSVHCGAHHARVVGLLIEKQRGLRPVRRRPRSRRATGA